MDERIRQRALTPRYSFPNASGLLGVPLATVRRWSVGNRRQRDGEAVFDEPLISVDGETGTSGPPLSFLNLVELQALRS